MTNARKVRVAIQFLFIVMLSSVLLVPAGPAGAQSPCDPRISVCK